MAKYCKNINKSEKKFDPDDKSTFLGPKAKQITARGQKCHLGQGPQQWSFSRYVDEVPSRTISEGIKYSNQEYTRVGYPILGYFRVQVPENL